MVKVHKLKITIEEYHEIMTVARRDIVEKIPDEIFPFIDWKKLPRVDYVAATLAFKHGCETKVYLAKEPFVIVLKDLERRTYEVHESVEYEIPDEIVPFLRDDVKKTLGLVKEKQENLEH